MNQSQIETAAAWLAAHKNEITRIRPRIAGSIVRYIPRKGWHPGLDGHIDGAPAMWAPIDGPDPLDKVFTQLSIPVDEPF